MFEIDNPLSRAEFLNKVGGIEEKIFLKIGDEKIKSISAASIIAKVYRDHFMIKLSKKFSNYDWDKNFGYGTKAHLEGSKRSLKILAHNITVSSSNNFMTLLRSKYGKDNVWIG